MCALVFLECKLMKPIPSRAYWSGLAISSRVFTLKQSFKSFKILLVRA